MSKRPKTRSSRWRQSRLYRRTLCGVLVASMGLAQTTGQTAFSGRDDYCLRLANAIVLSQGLSDWRNLVAIDLLHTVEDCRNPIYLVERLNYDIKYGRVWDEVMAWPDSIPVWVEIVENSQEIKETRWISVTDQHRREAEWRMIEPLTALFSIAVGGTVAYGGRVVAGISALTANITVSRSSGVGPLVVQCSVTGSSGTGFGNVWRDVDWIWELNDTDPRCDITHPIWGGSTSLNRFQRGPHATFVIYDDNNLTPTRTITLRGRGYSGSAYVTNTDTQVITLSARSTINANNRWIDTVGGNTANDGFDPNGFALTAATFTNATKKLNQTGEFTSYVHATAIAQGSNWIAITGGTGVTSGLYRIVAKDSNDQIELAVDIGGTNPTNVTSSSGPKATLADLTGFLSGSTDNLVCRWKRGSSWTGNGSNNTRVLVDGSAGGTNGGRCWAYGDPAGALPIFTAAATGYTQEVFFYLQSNGANEEINDWFISEFRIVTNGITGTGCRAFYVECVNEATTKASNVHFFDLEMLVKPRGITIGSFQTNQTVVTIEMCSVIKCDFDTGTTVGDHNLLTNNINWFSMIGCTHAGRGSDANLHHHVYFSGEGTAVGHHDTLVRWCDFGASVGRSFSINGNCCDVAGDTTDRWTYVENDFGGSARGCDFSSTDNDPVLQGNFDQLIVQLNRFGPYVVVGGTQADNWINNVLNAVWRDNRSHSSDTAVEGGFFHVESYTVVPMIIKMYRNHIWSDFNTGDPASWVGGNDSTTGGGLGGGATASGEFFDNQIRLVGNSVIAINTNHGATNMAKWSFHDNLYYAPDVANGTTNPGIFWRSSVTPGAQTWNTWKALTGTPDASGSTVGTLPWGTSAGSDFVNPDAAGQFVFAIAVTNDSDDSPVVALNGNTIADGDVTTGATRLARIHVLGDVAFAFLTSAITGDADNPDPPDTITYYPNHEAGYDIFGFDYQSGAAQIATVAINTSIFLTDFTYNGGETPPDDLDIHGRAWRPVFRAKGLRASRA